MQRLMTLASQSAQSERLRRLVEQIEYADQIGLMCLVLANITVGNSSIQPCCHSSQQVAARTQHIRLTSAVKVCCRPVRVFQEFATLDLLSQGRAEMVVRGSSIEAFLFGFRLEDYDSLFAEKLDLLLKIRDNEHLHWSGKYRPRLNGQGVYPRPLQNPLPIWIGVGGTPESFCACWFAWTPIDGCNNRWRNT